MLDVIKTMRICNAFNLSLVYFHNIKGYEVQYSNDNKIIETDGIYNNKKDGLKAFNKFLRRLTK